MPDESWVRSLAVAPKRPDMYQVGGNDAHLRSGITEPLRMVWEHRVLQDPRRCILRASPRQYHCRCETGPLLDGITELVVWHEQDFLLSALGEVQARLHRTPHEWARPFQRTMAHFAWFSSLLFLAVRGVIAIRTNAGLWCQAYERGWPKTPPFLVAGYGSSTGLMVAAALSPEWCPGLPFTPATVEQAIPEVARPHVTVEWHAEDDIVPECPVDPHCVLHPENIGRWL